MVVESYAFGRMVVRGRTYTSDLIIFPDRVEDSWWRKSGHSLVLEDMATAFEEAPDILVIGTGFMGVMKVTPDVKKYAAEKNIPLIIAKTKKAVERYNQLCLQKKTIGAFHLTC